MMFFSLEILMLESTDFSETWVVEPPNDLVDCIKIWLPWLSYFLSNGCKTSCKVLFLLLMAFLAQKPIYLP